MWKRRLMLSVAEGPDPADIADRLLAFEDAHRVTAHQARIGGLVLTFSNEEIHLLCEMGRLTISDVLDLRRLGLLAPDEGWTGGPRKKRRTTRPRGVEDVTQ